MSDNNNSVWSFFDKIGGAITYVRNFFINSLFIIFLFIGIFVLGVTLLVSAFTSNKDNTINDDKLSLEVMYLNFAETISDTPELLTSAQKLINTINDKETNYSYIQHIKKAIKYATQKDTTKAIAINASSLQGIRLDHLTQIGEELKNFRKTGKKVYFYSNNYTQSTYALASYADEIYIHHFGNIDISGISLKTLFFKDLLDNMKITVVTPKVGTHKSAVEPFTRNNMSDLVKKEYLGIANELWDQLSSIIKENRNIQNLTPYMLATDEQLDLIKSYNDNITDLYIKEKLVDKIGNFQLFIQNVCATEGCKLEPNKNNLLSIVGYDEKDVAANITQPNEVDFNLPRKNIDIIYGIGEISSYADDDNLWAFSPKNIIPLLHKVADDKNSIGVIMYLNTPGGEVVASDEIRIELEKLKSKGKHVVIYMSGMAASGGYWISTAGEKIIATPSTITGSIGVYSMLFSAKKLGDHIGVHEDGVTTNEEGHFSIFKEMSNNQITVAQKFTDQIYNKFLYLVTKSRNFPNYMHTNELAQGKIYTGNKALELNLVDELGDLKTAIAAMKKLDNNSDHSKYHINYLLPKEADSPASFLNSLLSNAEQNLDHNTALKLIDTLSKASVEQMPNSFINNLTTKTNQPQVVSYSPITLDY